MIVKFDGKPIEKSIDLSRIVGATKPGAKSTVTVFRKGPTKTFPLWLPKWSRGQNQRPVWQGRPKQGSLCAEPGPGGRRSDDAQKKELGLKAGVRVEAATEGWRAPVCVKAMSLSSLQGMRYPT